MISGVLVKPLKIFSHEKGDVLHMVRCNDPFFTQFGEVYFSFIRPGFVKGWKKHLKQIQHFAVPAGEIKLVLYDGRPSSPTKGRVQEIQTGRRQYCLVRIPPQVWYAFGAIGEQDALIANCTDIPHDPAEAVNIDITDRTVPYVWNLANR